MLPARVMTMDNTEAKMGRLMKKLENTIPASLAQHLVGTAARCRGVAVGRLVRSVRGGRVPVRGDRLAVGNDLHAVGRRDLARRGCGRSVRRRGVPLRSDGAAVGN